jgi:hypothetical protein
LKQCALEDEIEWEIQFRGARVLPPV